jgi:pimeloyl-ACP methyl ester carboxylesterase
LPASPQSHLEGAIGPGSTYAIDFPDRWNGDLVLYAHGIVEPGQPLVPPTTQDGYGPARDALLASGYAVAASSYSSNGWALADAMQRTHQLGKIFASKYGKPRRIFLVGHSLGALVITKMAETYPGQYAGAMPMCGPLGGALAEIRYGADSRVIFDYYFPGLLPGGPFDIPPGTSYLTPYDPGGPTPLFLQVYAALAADPQKAYQWAIAAGLPFANETELGYSALYVVGFNLRYTNDLVERVTGRIPYDNTKTAYAVNVTPDPGTNAYLSSLLNAGVARYESDPAAVNYYERNYEPSGKIGIPVLTIHTLRDPGIPVWHEQMFAEKVAAAGRSGLLRQRFVDRWGHCAIATPEIVVGFTELVAWVNSR